MFMVMFDDDINSSLICQEPPVPRGVINSHTYLLDKILKRSSEGAFVNMSATCLSKELYPQKCFSDIKASGIVQRLKMLFSSKPGILWILSPMFMVTFRKFDSSLIYQALGAGFNQLPRLSFVGICGKLSFGLICMVEISTIVLMDDLCCTKRDYKFWLLETMDSVVDHCSFPQRDRVLDCISSCKGLKRYSSPCCDESVSMLLGTNNIFVFGGDVGQCCLNLTPLSLRDTRPCEEGIFQRTSLVVVVRACGLQQIQPQNDNGSLEAESIVEAASTCYGSVFRQRRSVQVFVDVERSDPRLPVSKSFRRSLTKHVRSGKATPNQHHRIETTEKRFVIAAFVELEEIGTLDKLDPMDFDIFKTLDILAENCLSWD
ncbi:hypothetical protein Tco_0683308 [Tanacetum coccineum]|uniref:Uncharacterized protein n=1 Tax=Tanacetum coccineum TaxID=301880 RepID=A0ABQ4XTM3_9ASTR